MLAWWIVERHLRSGPPIPGAYILAANLLRAANQPHAAGRILSEAGGVDLVVTTAEFRRWSSGPDIARLALVDCAPPHAISQTQSSLEEVTLQLDMSCRIDVTGAPARAGSAPTSPAANRRGRAVDPVHLDDE